MFARRIAAIVFIFISATIAWVVLGSVTSFRTHEQDQKLKQFVGELWGTIQKQEAASIEYYETVPRSSDLRSQSGETTKIEELRKIQPYLLDGSDINVDLKLEPRKKGLLWYATYRVKFAGKYSFKNDFSEDAEFIFTYKFPAKDGIYDNFSFLVDGEPERNIQPIAGVVTHRFILRSKQESRVDISYGSQGMDEWWYAFGENVSQIRNFKLTATTDFGQVDFPENSISPTHREITKHGSRLTWQFSSLISGIQIGIKMPQKLNPGPFASRVSFFAPVSLFLFFFLIFIITTVKRIEIHPMNYFFIAAAFFGFHLLLTYLADHIDIYLAFAISAAVSILLVISYMRLVVGPRFAILEIGLSQLVYLVFFSYTFFLTGYTGLTITICCILTLFAVMQFTGKTDWGAISAVKNAAPKS
jgi:inner membrane protein involved in colicin E2 resistance